MDYHFGVKGWMVWLLHIIYGIYFIYLGRLLNNLENKELRNNGMILFGMGMMVIAYHAHIWYDHRNK